MADELKLNLGCGNGPVPGYVNIDIERLPSVDKVCDLRKPLPYADCSVDKILGNGIVEHLPWYEIEGILLDWARVLKVGGVMRLSITDFAGMFRDMYMKNEFKFSMVNMAVYGRTRTQWERHWCLITSNWLLKRMAAMGIDMHVENRFRTTFVVEGKKLYHATKTHYAKMRGTFSADKVDDVR